jgi:hypothetical protein
MGEPKFNIHSVSNRIISNNEISMQKKNNKSCRNIPSNIPFDVQPYSKPIRMTKHTFIRQSTVVEILFFLQ